MESPERNVPELTPTRRRVSWILSAVGLVVLLAGVFHLTSATVGGRVREFSERRTYVGVKRNAHRVFPVAALIGLSGLGLMILGAQLRKDSNSDS